MDDLFERIAQCRLCADDFAKTATMHEPRPVLRGRNPDARVLIVGQAPGLRVHESGVPFDDRSGDRLRQWLGVTREEFYDEAKFAVVPMAFCFPGYDDKGSDLPPQPRCVPNWRHPVLDRLPNVRLTVVIGQYAMAWHLGGKKLSVTARVARWREYLADGKMPIPHPSWRNNAFIRKNPWFETETLPALREVVRGALGG